MVGRGLTDRQLFNFKMCLGSIAVEVTIKITLGIWRVGVQPKHIMKIVKVMHNCR